MERTFQDLCWQLRQLTTVRQVRLQTAHEVLTTVNVLIDELARSELLNEAMLLGRIIDVEQNLPDGRPLQAALLVPGGMGIVVWSGEAPSSLSEWPFAFRRLEDCDAAEKELMLPQVPSLLNRLCDQLRQLYREPGESDLARTEEET